MRPSHEPPEPPRLPDTADAIDRIMQQPAAAPHHGEDMPVRSEATADIHGPADVANRIASLKRDGVEQLTDPAAIKAMKPEQVVQAQREGRLMTYMTGITAPASDG